MDFFDSYFDYVKDTEPPKIFHLWSLLTGISALVGRKLYFKNGPLVTYPNLYVMLVGSPGTRKSTAIKHVKRLMKQAGYKTFAADKSTKPKFLLDLEAGFEFENMQSTEPTGLGSASISKLLGTSLDAITDGKVKKTGPSEVCIAADEFLDFFGRGDIDFATLLGVLWDKDDDYVDRLKNSQSICIPEPTVSILGGTTHENFKMMFPPELLGQGFISRLLLVYGESSGRKITFLKADDEAAKAKLVQFMAAISKHAPGEVKFSEKAAEALDSIYQNWEDLEDARFRHYSTRRFTQLLKLCLLVIATRLADSIELEDVIFANTLLTHAELHMTKAMGEYGKGKNSEAAHKVMDVLNHAVAPMTIKDLWTQLVNDLDKQSDLATLLMGMAEADKIQRAGGGFLPKKKIKYKKSSMLWVDFKLLERFDINVV